MFSFLGKKKKKNLTKLDSHGLINALDTPNPADPSTALGKPSATLINYDFNVEPEYETVLDPLGSGGDKDQIDLDGEGSKSEKDPEPIYSVVNKQINSTSPNEDKKDAGDDMRAFIDSIVADMDTGIKFDDPDSDQSSSEEMKTFGNSVKPKKPPRTMNKTSPNGTESDSPTGNRSPAPNGGSPKVKVSLNGSPTGSDINDDTHNDIDEDGNPVLRKKSVSFNDVVQERPRSMYSENSQDGALDQPKEHMQNGVPNGFYNPDIGQGEPGYDYRGARPKDNWYPNGHHQYPNGNEFYERQYTPDEANVLENYDPNDVDKIVQNVSDGETFARHDLLDRNGENFTRANETYLSLPPDNVSEDCLSVGSDIDSSDHEEDPPKPKKVMRMRKRRMAILIFAWFCMGLISTLPGSTLPYLVHHLNTTYEPISRTFLARGAGYFIGSLFGGAIFSFHGYFEFVLATCMIILGGSVGATPWCKVWWYAALAFAGDGFAKGLLSIGSVLYVIRVWNEDKIVMVFIQLLYIVSAIGGAITPQVVRPFMVEKYADAIRKYLEVVGFDELLKLNGYHLELKGNETVIQREVNTTDVAPNIKGNEDDAAMYLFLAVAFLCVVCGIIFIFIFCHYAGQVCAKSVRDVQIRRYEKRKLKKKMKTIAPPEITVVPGSFVKQTTVIEEDETNENETGDITSKIEDHDDKASSVSSGSVKSDTKNKDNADMIDFTTKPSIKSHLEGLKNNMNGYSTLDSNGKMSTLDSKNGYSTLDSGFSTLDSKKNLIANGKSKSENNVKFAKGTKDVNKETAKKVKRIKKPKKKTAWFQNGEAFDVPTLMFLYAFFSLPMAIESIFNHFLFFFATDCDVHLTTLEASLLVSTFFGTMAISRAIAIPISKLVPPNAIMVASLVMNLTAASILSTYGNRYPILMWLFLILFALSLGPIFPGGLTWANVYLNYCAKSMALAHALAGLGAMLFTWLAGLFLEYWGLKSILYLIITGTALCLLLYLPVMKGLGARKLFALKQMKRKSKDQTLMDSHKTYL